MERHVSSQQFSAHLGEVLDVVNKVGDYYVIEQNGQPIAALVSMKELENRKPFSFLFKLYDRVLRYLSSNADDQLDLI